MCNTICNKCLRVCHVDIDEREYIKRNQSHIRCARPIQLKDKDVPSVKRRRREKINCTSRAQCMRYYDNNSRRNRNAIQSIKYLW